MSKKRKIIIWSVVGVLAAAVAGTLLGIFIPPLVNNNQVSQTLEKNQVDPSQGNGNFLTYNIVDALPANLKVQSIKDFALASLKNDAGMSEFAAQTVSNILVDFFKNIKNSRSYQDKFKQWENDINKSFDDKVKEYQDQYKDDWQFYFQSQVLDPVGGNENDFKRNALFEKVNAEFDSLIKKNLYVNLTDASGKNVITNVTESDLFSDKIFNVEKDKNGQPIYGKPCNIKFVPANNSTTDFAPAIANFQEFIFDKYVRMKMPIITSMVLFKQEAPQANGTSDYFNVKLATNNNGGTDPIGTEPSYMWQVFNPEVYNADGTWNATAKYNNFVNDISNPNAQFGPLIWDNLGGAININKIYTDDSATLFLINANDVFTTSFTPYAAASIYKLNNLLFGVTDSRVPVKDVTGQQISTGFATGLKEGEKIIPGTEIMSNFMRKGTPAEAPQTQPPGEYYFQLPSVIKEILNSNTKYNFVGKYNGITEITETVDIKGSPFIMTRDEAGVHIIGIDRYAAIKGAANYEGKIQEIKNTLLWRYLISQTKNDAGESVSNTTGFTYDLATELQNFYSSFRNELIIEYIIENETTTPTNPKDYIFSNTYAEMKYPMDPAPADSTKPKKLITDNEVALFNAYYDYKDYAFYATNNDTVRTKILETQKPYVGKSFGNPDYNNAPITNGIAGILPYSRDTTPNNVETALSSNGVYDDTFGMYNSINWHFNSEQSNPQTEAAADNQTSTIFSNVELDKKKTAFQSAVQAYVENLSTNHPLGMKTLTYSSAKYNQWLEVGNNDGATDKYFANSGEKINHAIFKWIDTSEIQNIVINQKIQAYLDGKGSTLNQDNNYLISNQEITSSKQQKPKTFANGNQGSSAGSDTSSSETITGLPTNIPSNPPKLPNPSNPADLKNITDINNFINSYLQYAKNIIDNVSIMNADNYFKYGSWTNFADLYNQALYTTAANVKNGSFTAAQQDVLKNFITLLYAFDYGPSNPNDPSSLWTYNFTKFRDYLLNATNNYNRAAFVWTSKEKIRYIQDYGNNQDVDFGFKPKIFNTVNNTFGYGYIDAGADSIKPMSSQPLKFESNVTFDDRSVYYNYVSPYADLAKWSTKYTGFLGMQFEGNTSSDLDSEVANLIFGSGAKYIVKPNQSAGSGQSSTLQAQAKGALYNISGDPVKGREILNTEIDKIRNNNQKISMLNWLNYNFPPANEKQEVTDNNGQAIIENGQKITIQDLQNQIIQSVQPSDFIPKLKLLAKNMIPDIAFSRVQNEQLANTKNSIQNPNSIKYFGDVNNYASQVIVTQFNHDDVVELFNTDTSTDKQVPDEANPRQMKTIHVIDEKDRGINWTVASTKGFLGASPDAFFFSAYQWAMNNSLYANNAFNEMRDQQGKIDTYDRRLNNLFGADWVSNYKKEN